MLPQTPHPLWKASKRAQVEPMTALHWDLVHNVQLIRKGSEMLLLQAPGPLAFRIQHIKLTYIKWPATAFTSKSSMAGNQGRLDLGLDPSIRTSNEIDEIFTSQHAWLASSLIKHTTPIYTK